jgi:hypothetical protein
MSVTIYGAGDDLIKVDGDVDEKFTIAAAAPEDGAVLAISEGTVLRITRDSNGVWRINPVVRGSGALSITQAPREGDADNYSDHATIRGLILWVVLGNSLANAAAVAR